MAQFPRKTVPSRVARLMPQFFAPMDADTIVCVRLYADNIVGAQRTFGIRGLLAACGLENQVVDPVELFGAVEVKL